MSDPLTDKERELRRRADEVEGEANRLSVDRALLAIKATLDSERATEEPAALDERVNDLTDEAVRLEAQAAKARLDAESRKPENERSAIRGQQSSEERVLEATNTRRQLMIDAGAFDISPVARRCWRWPSMWRIGCVGASERKRRSGVCPSATPCSA